MKKRKLSLILTMLLIILSTTGCGTKYRLRQQIEKLLEENSSLKKENSELKKGQQSELYTEEPAMENEDSESYINIKFYIDGNIYKIRNEEIPLYRDVDCNILEDEDVQIISPIIDTIEVQKENGETVLLFAVRGVKDGQTVMLFSPQYPTLEVVE